jgi:hypothetical protein
MNTIQDLKDATAFELLLLQTILEAGESSSQVTIDLTCPKEFAGNHYVSKVALSGNDVKALKAKLFPLVFGAGWKIIDLILEYEITQAGLCRPGDYIKISTKKNLALNKDILGVNLDCEQQTWHCILDAYAHTVEHRHCLVHRTAEVGEATGELNGTCRSTNQALVTLTQHEQIAFASSAVLTAKGILDGGICQRNEAFLKYHLNQLANHSRASILAGASAPKTVEVKILLQEDNHGLFVNLGEELKRINQNQLTSYYDVVFKHPTKQALKMKGQSELIPLEKVYIDLDSPPGWLSIG